MATNKQISKKGINGIQKAGLLYYEITERCTTS